MTICIGRIVVRNGFFLVKLEGMMQERHIDCAPEEEEEEEKTEVVYFAGKKSTMAMRSGIFIAHAGR